MRIITEKHICDRCGKEIKNPVSDYRGVRKIFNFPKSMLLEKEEIEGYFTSVPEILLSDSVNLDICYSSNRKKIELCHKCKKAFEKFMEVGD